MNWLERNQIQIDQLLVNQSKFKVKMKRMTTRAMKKYDLENVNHDERENVNQ